MARGVERLGERVTRARRTGAQAQGRRGAGRDAGAEHVGVGTQGNGTTAALSSERSEAPAHLGLQAGGQVPVACAPRDDKRSPLLRPAPAPLRRAPRAPCPPAPSPCPAPAIVRQCRSIRGARSGPSWRRPCWRGVGAGGAMGSAYATPLNPKQAPLVTVRQLLQADSLIGRRVRAAGPAPSPAPALPPCLGPPGLRLEHCGPWPGPPSLLPQ